MNTVEGRTLFAVAAVYNLLAALPLLVAGETVGRLIGMEPLPTPTLFVQISLITVLLFGWAYWQVSRDPAYYRPYITLGIIGKLIFVAVIFAHWAMGNTNGALPTLAAGDIVFAALFWRYLKRTPIQK